MFSISKIIHNQSSHSATSDSATAKLSDSVSTTNESAMTSQSNLTGKNQEEESNNEIDYETTSDNKSINNKNVTSYSSNPPSRNTNILLIGLSYNTFIRNQYVNDSNVSCITKCRDLNGHLVESSVARDTYRCIVLEKTYPTVKVFTVNKCEDHLCQCDNDKDPFNINKDVCTSQFMHLIRSKKWKFHEIYVDDIRMNKSYVETNFGKKNFSNLVEMMQSNIIVDEKNNPGKVYLPFNPHFFNG